MDEINVFNIGLSDKKAAVNIRVDYNNMASSRVEDNILDEHRENYTDYVRAQFITLNEHIKSEGIDINEIVGIWIDTEGHEPEIFFGGSEIFSQCDAPVYMEFNPAVYRNKGVYDSFLRELMKIYSFFICWEDYAKGKSEKRLITDLPRVEDEMDNVFCNLLLLK